MAFEVMPRAGQLRMRDVRAILGPRALTAEHIDVLVLGQAGEPPSAGRVLLADLPGGGRGVHRGLVCPRCLSPKLMLLTDGLGGLGCSRCLRRRTRRQSERTAAAWNRCDGKLEDELFRRLSGPRSTAAVTLDRAEKIVSEIVAGDLDRVAALSPFFQAAVVMSTRVRQ